ncbi:GerAB/ArcD/ProY family transporter [Clostridium neuense]|uniref:GerAB/ArcD/ProY family transporter n=1 Tax=Clostridium neuense TaxID=1728934 RepID=A0ABW8TJG3_9CLOT
MIRLSKHQLFALMFIFEVGSTTLFALGIEAKQDAWIVILLALLIGIILVWIYTELQNAFPDKNYVDIAIAILGNKLGIPYVLLTTLGYFWHCARNLREFGELIIITTLPEAKLWFINSIFVLVSLYALIKGIEVLARASEVVIPIIIVFIIGLYILVYLSGDIEISNLTPVLGGGIGPIIKTLPEVSVFPFGEMFVFLMYWNYAGEKRIVRKTAIKTVILSGILLCFTVLMDISVLGAKYTSLATIPLLETVRVVNIGNIITNIDSIAIIIIFLGGFFKMSIYLNAVALAFSSLFKVSNYKLVLVVITAILLWFSLAFESSYAFHKWLFPFDTQYFGIVYTNITPLLLLMIYKIKKKRINF